MSCTGQR